MIVGAYSLHLYCDHPRHPTKEQAAKHSAAAWGLYRRFHPGDFTGNFEGAARKDARNAGWVFKRGGKVFCPECGAGRFIIDAPAEQTPLKNWQDSIETMAHLKEG